MAKTIKVAWVIDRANRLMKSDLLSREAKRGVEALLRGVLYETGNYEGFGYPEVHWDPESQSHKLSDGTVVASQDSSEDKWDDQVVEYYTSNKLR